MPERVFYGIVPQSPPNHRLLKVHDHSIQVSARYYVLGDFLTSLHQRKLGLECRIFMPKEKY